MTDNTGNGIRFERLKWALWQAKRRGYLRRLVATWAKWQIGKNGGGMIPVEPDILTADLLRGRGHTPKRSLDDYTKELRRNDLLRPHYEAMAVEHDLPKFANWDAFIDFIPGQIALFYATIRETEPQVVLETGTATGSMSAIMLAALKENGTGKLISIDLPPVDGELTMASTVDESQIGFFIPQSYRDIWDYRKGDAKALLAATLLETKVDIFVHDSLHTRTHMVFEYAVARALMKPDTLILSDDILWNNSFNDFLVTNQLTGFVPFGNPNIGGFCNRFDAFELGVGTDIVTR
ncbi:MAG TPA: hypothetical protein ENI69_00660 [Rhodospirillales bacterium]|nr:hypothetical protein [Rhodospirillales bacterium]